MTPRPVRSVPPSARLAADALLVALVAVALVLIAAYWPTAPTAPRFPPAVERSEPPRLPR